MEENASIKALREAIDRSRYMVFFGGAGVSTESGIPDFRTPPASTISLAPTLPRRF